MEEAWRELSERALMGVMEWRGARARTFTEIEEEVETRLAPLRRQMVEDLAMADAAATLSAQPAQARPRCLECGGALWARGVQQREVLTQRGDLVRLERSYGVCQTCGAGVFPPR